MRRSPQLVPVTPRGGVGSRCQPALAIARPVTATKHEPGLSPLCRVVSYDSAVEVWAFLVRLSPHQRARSKVFAVVPPWRAAWTRWLSVVISAAAAKAMFIAVLNGTALSSPEPVSFSCDPESWACGQATSESTAKDIISLASVSPLALQLHRCSIGSLHACHTIFAILRTPTRFFSFFAVTQQQWRACVRRMLRCKLACVLPSSSLDPRLTSGAFAVAKDEGRESPLNSRERSIGRAHLPCCPRLRRMILENSETVQITIGDTKDCFLLLQSFSFTRDETSDRSSHPPKLA